MRLFHKEFGEGMPLLILHGLLGASGNWFSLSRNIFAQHFRVLTVDLRNHGRSPHDARFDYPSMTADIVDFLDHMEIEQAHVMGHSMGGKVAMWLALEHNDRVAKLAVVDMAPRAYPPHHLPILEGLRALDLPAYGSRGEVDAALAAHVKEIPVRQFLLKNLASDGKGTFAWKMNLDVIYENYTRINEPVETTKTFNKPTLFIRGGRSTYIRNEDEEGIRQLFPHAQLITIPEAGHWVHAEAPQAFATNATTFFLA